eukprot:TRINITY_DN5611_c0_g1_i1.p1 TRINITY_DN5611_c0_g1~~TRINITY_DN5611_c0_g1_i1.p1  ORF type:complete len:133 (-),score=13.48 TRINITY_DN5611_c0_g1_i1:770-1168(-)
MIISFAKIGSVPSNNLFAKLIDLMSYTKINNIAEDVFIALRTIQKYHSPSLSESVWHPRDWTAFITVLQTFIPHLSQPENSMNHHNSQLVLRYYLEIFEDDNRFNIPKEGTINAKISISHLRTSSQNAISIV